MTETLQNTVRWTRSYFCVWLLACGNGGTSAPSPSLDGGPETAADAGADTAPAQTTSDASIEPPDDSTQDGSAAEDSSTGRDASTWEPPDAEAEDDASVIDPKPPENFFSDVFTGFDEDLWSCEYSCPTASDGAVHFLLEPGIAPNNYGSWSKVRYKPRRFTSGKFTVRFALTKRPEQKVWWGAALWDDGPNPDGSEFNEVNFGYTTNQSFSNTQLLFESARRGKFESVKVDTGVDLYDGAYHTATLEYDASHVALYFDGELLHTITDTSVIPTDPMDFILGPRLVTGSTPLDESFTERVDLTEIAW